MRAAWASFSMRCIVCVWGGGPARFFLLNQLEITLERFNGAPFVVSLVDMWNSSPARRCFPA